jgi:hypothetical protein
MSNQDINDFLNGGGGRAAKFEEMGDFVEGEITEVKLSQQTDMESGAPLTWSDGSPRMQLVIAIKTDQTDGENDDGVRRIYAKGGNYEVASGSGKSMKDAIADAVKKANARTIEEGGYIKVAYTGQGKKTNRGFSAPKLWKASYKVPVQSVAAEDLFED